MRESDPTSAPNAREACSAERRASTAFVSSAWRSSGSGSPRPASAACAAFRQPAWIAGCRNASQGTDTRLAELRQALDANSLLARRSALQASRALGALVAPDSRTYDDEGMTQAPTGRREAFSA